MASNGTLTPSPLQVGNTVLDSGLQGNSGYRHAAAPGRLGAVPNTTKQHPATVQNLLPNPGERPVKTIRKPVQRGILGGK